MFKTFSTALRSFRAWRERERVLNELYSLDDRMLGDIGLQRDDIPGVVSAVVGSAAESRRAPSPAGNTDTEENAKRQAA